MSYMFVLLILLVLSVLFYFMGGFKMMGRRREATPALPTEGAREAAELRYAVPEGQDPAMVIAALRSAGYDAARDAEANSNDVVVHCEQDTPEERDRIRTVIAQDAPLNMEDDPISTRVRFTDE